MRGTELQNCLSMTQSLLRERSHILRCRTALPPPQLPTQPYLYGAPASDPTTTISVIAATTYFLMTLMEEWGVKPQPKEVC